MAEPDIEDDDQLASLLEAYEALLADGKLYIRDLGMLWCYDVKAE
jgi:hypothetical protein